MRGFLVPGRLRVASQRSASTYTLVSLYKNFYYREQNSNCEVYWMEMKLVIDGKEIPLNEFVSKILTGTVVGAVTSLRGIREDWKKIEVEITK
jgi:hypothetical protein